MTCVLFTSTGERKYLTEAEHEAFIAAAIAHEYGPLLSGAATGRGEHRNHICNDLESFA